MYTYTMRWAHFDTLDEYDDLRRCTLLMGTKWQAESHEDLLLQVSKANNGLKITSISYSTSFDTDDSQEDCSESGSIPVHSSSSS